MTLLLIIAIYFNLLFFFCNRKNVVGHAHTRNVANCALSYATESRATSHARLFYHVIIPVLAFAGNRVQSCAESVMKKNC